MYLPNSNQPFYTYAHYTANSNEIFYVGKGSKKRAWSNKDRTKHWHNIVSKHGIIVKIIAYFYRSEDALSFERQLILLIGRLNVSTGPLINLTDGGVGVAGMSHSLQSKNLISKSLKHQHAAGIRTKAYAKIALAQTGSKNHEFGKIISLERRNRLSEASKGKSKSSTHRRNISNAKRGDKNPAAKITKQIALEINRLKGTKTIANIAIDFGVSATTVQAIHSGKRWIT